MDAPRHLRKNKAGNKAMLKAASPTDHEVNKQVSPFPPTSEMLLLSHLVFHHNLLTALSNSPGI